MPHRDERRGDAGVVLGLLRAAQTSCAAVVVRLPADTESRQAQNGSSAAESISNQSKNPPGLRLWLIRVPQSGDSRSMRTFDRRSGPARMWNDRIMHTSYRE